MYQLWSILLYFNPYLKICVIFTHEKIYKAGKSWSQLESKSPSWFGLAWLLNIFKIHPDLACAQKQVDIQAKLSLSLEQNETSELGHKSSFKLGLSSDSTYKFLTWYTLGI